MTSPVSRRTFLAAGAGLALAAACSRDKEPAITVDDEEDDKPDDLALVMASYVHATGIEQRVTLAFVRDKGPEKLDQPWPIVLWAPDGTELTSIAPALHDQEIPMPYLRFHYRFEKPGTYEVEVSYKQKPYKAALTVTRAEDVKVPIPGRPLIATATPTVADNRGVSPICTRKTVCPLHDVSLDAALAERRPLALLFSTPALCKSQLCGPVLENLLAHHGEFGNRVRFLHVEVYTDTSGKTLAPAVQAYHLESEPFLFLAGADGVVRERLDNAFDRLEVKEALQALVA